MTTNSALLYAYGFTSGKPIIMDNKPVKVEGDTPEKKLESIKKLRTKYEKDKKLAAFDEQLQTAADHDWQEVTKEQEMLVDYPAPLSKYIMVYETPSLSIEPVYYFVVDMLESFGFPIIDKVTDIFTAAEHSSFYGASAQRLGLAQDKVAQYLASVGKMVKDLFALVRELRWIDERLQYYKNARGEDLLTEKEVKEGKKLSPEEKNQRMQGAEVALKGLWVDLVDGVVGGQRTGSNLWTMAQQLQFSTLPDLFFSIHPPNKEVVGEYVDKEAKDFNKMVKMTLKRKLYAYLAWKESTYEEMVNRRRFTLNYLRQHFNIIRMYLNWVKPYLKHIEKLQAPPEKINSAQIISAFEGSLVDVEVLARYFAKGNKKVYSCILLSMEYRTRPQMQYAAEGGYHRGPVHIGVAKIYWRTYSWTEEQVNNYLAMRNREDIELLAGIDRSLKDAMDSLGEDFMSYLKEAEFGKPEEKEEARPKKPKADYFQPIKDVVGGGKEIFSTLKSSLNLPKPKATDPLGHERAAAGGMAKFWCWMSYKLFKKGHQMLTW
ncbi:hypothetical protein KY329_00910 [Candidatus Woesearchaeota archaeon]|nr:hypothetical protein [Candidatus Woesearchaeota archaeon]